MDGSTEQMQAYAALLEGVSSSLSADGSRSVVTPEQVRRQVLAVMGREERVHPAGWPPKH